MLLLPAGVDRCETASITAGVSLTGNGTLDAPLQDVSCSPAVPAGHTHPQTDSCHVLSPAVDRTLCWPGHARAAACRSGQAGTCAPCRRSPCAPHPAWWSLPAAHSQLHPQATGALPLCSFTVCYQPSPARTNSRVHTGDMKKQPKKTHVFMTCCSLAKLLTVRMPASTSCAVADAAAAAASWLVTYFLFSPADRSSGSDSRGQHNAVSLPL
jgi:hypothetical protein